MAATSAGVVLWARHPATGPRPMRTGTPRSPLVWTPLLLLGALSLLAPGSDAQQRPWPNPEPDPIVSPVAGPSWLKTLGVPLRDTRLGQGSGRYGPAPDSPPEAPAESLSVRPALDLSGEDLYRLNCRACHGDQGTGRPPEIGSVVDPVRGSSLSIVRERLRRENATGGEEAAREATLRARAAVLRRLHEGGQRMPPRDYLQDADIQVLFAYLTELSGAPDPDPQSTRRVSWARLGELTVKGTCHICHDAVGARPSPAEMLRGAIPSLASLVATKPIGEFVHKAESGDVVSLSAPGVRHRGRMPVFYYLRDEEVAAAYMYLSTYPPRPAVK
jgi:mono/diheme cytochrome c family protein